MTEFSKSMRKRIAVQQGVETCDWCMLPRIDHADPAVDHAFVPRPKLEERETK